MQFKLVLFLLNIGFICNLSSNDSGLLYIHIVRHSQIEISRSKVKVIEIVFKFIIWCLKIKGIFDRDLIHYCSNIINKNKILFFLCKRKVIIILY